MQSATLVSRPVGMAVWSGRVLSAVVVAFMTFDGVLHIVQPAPVAEAFARLGVPIRLSLGLGVVELICTALYAVPRTAFVGALLLTGYLGGAVATQLRAGSSAFETIFPLIVGAFLWGGFWLRSAELRRLVRS